MVETERVPPPFIEDGGGENEAETILRKRRRPCKGPGAERSRAEQTLMRPHDVSMQRNPA